MKILLRRLVLAGSGLTFGSIAVLAVVRPHAVAERYGLRLEGVEAYNEFRAIFVGFWLALATMLFVAARRPDRVLLGDMCGLALAAQAGGRLLSVIVDGVPRAEFMLAMVGEMIAGAIVLGCRPGRPGA